MFVVFRRIWYTKEFGTEFALGRRCKETEEMKGRGSREMSFEREGLKLRNTANRQASAAMGGYSDDEYVSVGEVPLPRADNFKRVSMLPLVFIIFYEVSGGPFGVEDAVGAAGPLLALLGFLVFPFIWSIPEALLTAEMGTMFPENGGYVVWVSAALGPYWGFQQGWMKWLSGVIDNALYPVLFLDYLKSAIPALEGGLPRVLAVIALTVVLTYMNYRGLTIVGWVAVLLGIFSLLPFVVMGLVAIPKLEPSRWLEVNLQDVDWNLYLNTLFWNLNYWDSISTLAGEVDNPKRTLPKALLYALILVVLGYFFPLLTGTGAVSVNRGLWTDGYFSDIAKIIGGVWLRWWVQGAAAMSNMGMFVAEMSSDSFQLLGMAERGMLPEFFGKRSRHGTPLIGIIFSASGVLLLSWLSFQEIVAAENFLYCFGMILEFIAFVWLRIKHPNASRPYKIPLGTVGAILMCVPPTILICAVLALSTLKVFLISMVAVVIGLVMQPCLRYVEKKRWIKFSISSELPDLHANNQNNNVSLLD
ncbi:probable polyamine transporter At1g31830 isoform X2 [Juglans microcarpa x Juglans regia]|uniref:probable polyamine transporter At1g31830 isoform X2 n=1 Tax=Juglans microcarpa x Juglans regia TaxID=2249226 RepID=UPI001B7F1577|nr:probable polyamine transporter At1g31830 isoform X2 [Juglans microcarpa x Juglans regia]XP_040986154.1 probable polyamine transporter At1g31830 isoform X2 [Juglans microcarpa x Juglans regia]